MTIKEIMYQLTLLQKAQADKEQIEKEIKANIKDVISKYDANRQDLTTPITNNRISLIIV
jgi:polyhydroxyalkanoate synthesis regulator phasin